MCVRERERERDREKENRERERKETEGEKSEAGKGFLLLIGHTPSAVGLIKASGTLLAEEEGGTKAYHTHTHTHTHTSLIGTCEITPWGAAEGVYTQDRATIADLRTPLSRQR